MSSPSNKPLVSLVMPVHNMDATICRAIESLQRQTCEDFELLVVDLNSDDRSCDVVARMADRDIRITLLHQDESDIQATFNQTLSRVRGDYLMFIAGTDWLEPCVLETYIAAFRQHACDMVLAPYVLDGTKVEKNLGSKKLQFAETIFDTQADFRSAAWRLLEAGLFDNLWGKAFTRACIEQQGLQFRQQSLESNLFVLDYIRDIRRVALLAESGYHHVIESDSLSLRSCWRKASYERLQHDHRELLNLYHHWGLDGDPASMEVIQRRYIEDLFSLMSSICHPSCELNNAEKRQRISQMISSDTTQLAARMARPKSRFETAILSPIRTRNLALVMAGATLGGFFMQRNAKKGLRNLHRPG